MIKDARNGAKKHEKELKKLGVIALHYSLNRAQVDGETACNSL